MAEQKSFRIRGILPAAEAIQKMLLFEAAEPEPDFIKLRMVLSQDIARLKKSLNALGIQPGNLPARSMHAVAWLFFLQNDAQLIQHVQALAALLQQIHAEKMRCLHAEFLYSNTLFRVQSTRDGSIFRFHEGYIAAPPEILRSLILLGKRQRGQEKHRQQVLAFSKTEPFRAVNQQLAQFSRAVYVEADAQGKYRSLKTAFDRVNWAYFDGTQRVPHLCWSGAPNYRKFGHFNPISDTVQVSSALDDSETPEYVLDFILYHELLHRDLGIVERNHRKLAHRTEFRRQEQDFAQYEKAIAYLKQLSQKVS